jgi:hypothetical protein
MLDIDQAIIERYSARMFLREPVPRELVDETLAPAREVARRDRGPRGRYSARLERTDFQGAFWQRNLKRT